MKRSAYLRVDALRLLCMALSLLLCTSFLATPSQAQEFTARYVNDYGNVTIMEITGNYDSHNPDGSVNVLPRQLIAREFFKTHKDDYDFLVIFSNFDVKMPKSEARAFYSSIKNDVRGIGQQIFDHTALYGSNGKLQGTIDMGNIAGNVSDPLQPGFELTLDTLSHEMLHRWSSYVRFKDTTGNMSTALLGEDSSHWSYLLDTKGSLQYGNQWRVNGDGTFTSGLNRKYYSSLDLYLMGMIDKSKVPPMLLIDNPAIDPARMPENGVTISGTPRYVTIDDIIAAEGERTPDVKDSQKQFKTAFIYVTTPGTFTGQELYGIENIRNGFLTRYSILTDGKGLVQIASTPRDDVPTNPGVRPPTTVPRSLLPNIDDGVNWLTAHQMTDGSWTDFVLTTERDTAEAVTSLQLFPAANRQFLVGLAWLGSSASANTDFLARRIEAVTRSGGDNSALIQQLLTRRNSDGGWGSGSNFLSNPTDTALALKALALAGYGDQQVIDPAIAYLQTSQNPDGGWSGEDTVSTIQPTAAVVSAFNAYRQSHALDANLSRAIAFLAGKQNPDGGFGNSPSTVYDSAAALMALQEAGADRGVISGGVNYLLGQQADDGSWYDSPYQTALAVRAVWQASVEPDLSIKPSDMFFIPEKVTSLPTNAVLSAVLWNLGRTDVPQAKVAIYDGAIVSEKKVGEQTVSLPGMSPTTVTFSVPVIDGNGHLFYVVVDPDNLIKETNRSNNSASKRLLPEATYDFAVTSSDITASPSQLDVFQEMRITAKVSNRGTSDAYNVQVRFFIDEPGAPFEIATITTDIPAGASVVREVVWKAAKVGGGMPLAVEADPFNAFTELSEENNKGATSISVNNVAITDPNLTISSRNINIAPNPARQGGSATVTATVKNDGFSTATGIKVSFYRGPSRDNSILFGEKVIPSLARNESAQVSLNWDNINDSGETKVFILVDPENTITEIAEDDNNTSVSLRILSLPDLAVSANSIVLNPSAPMENASVSIAVTVNNSGDQQAADVPVNLYEGGALLGTRTIPLIGGNSQATATFTYTASMTGSHQVTAVVDPAGIIQERSKDNNSATKTFAVQNSKLWVSEQYISPNGDGVKDNSQLFFRLAAVTTVKVVVINKKGEAVRTFSGGSLDNSLGNTVVWDGLNDEGMVVTDGEYQLQIRDVNEAIHGSLPVIVDNNRLPLADAIGTDYFLKKNIGCNANFKGENWNWLSDESGFIVSAVGPYPHLHRILGSSLEGEEINRIYPAPPEYEYKSAEFANFSQQLGGNKYSFVSKWSGSEYTLFIGEREKVLGSFYLGTSLSTFDQKWSEDGSRLAISTYGYSCQSSLYLVNTANDPISFKKLRGPECGYISFDLSPDGTKAAYISNNRYVYVADNRSGAASLVYTSNTNIVGSLKWLDSTRLIFSKYQNGTFIFDTVNGTETKISNFDYPTLAPNNKKLLVLTDSGADILANDGSIIGQYTSSVMPSGYSPSWSPDSRYAVVDVYNGNLEQLILLDSEAHHEIVIAPEKAPITFKWLDSNTLIYAGFGGELKSYDVLTNETKVIHSFADVPWAGTRDFAVSPLGGYLSWSDPDDYSCQNPSYFVASSTLNLTGGLSIVKGSQNVAVKGTAMDANFGGWKLEYADTKSPDTWNLVAPPSDVPGVDDVFATWAPPSAGTYTIRLTVWDKAGNMVVRTRGLTWMWPPTVNAYKSLDVFSPNGDGAKDTVEIYYTLPSPAPVEFSVYDTNNALVYTGYSPYGSDRISWGGIDEAGKIVSDSKYKIKVLDQEFTVEVDNTPPDVSIHLGNVVPYKNEFFNYFYLEISGHVFDKKIKKWVVEYGEGANPQEWHEYSKGEYVIIKRDDNGSPILNPIGDDLIKFVSGEEIPFLVGKKLKITAEDFAGNKSSALSGFLEQRVVLFSWDANAPYQLQKDSFMKTIGFKHDWNFYDGQVLNQWDSREVFNVTRLDPENPQTHSLEYFELLRHSVAARYLQYFHAGVWRDAAVGFDSGNAHFHNENVRGAEALRIKIVDVDGNEYLSNTYIPYQLSKENPSGEDPPFIGSGHGGDNSYGISASFQSAHIEADGCGVLSGKIEVPTDRLLVQDAQFLSFMLQTNSGPKSLGQVDLTSRGLRTLLLDTSDIPEGVYPLKAVFTLTDSTTKEIPSTNQVIVDRTLPTAHISSPAGAQAICPVKTVDAQGEWIGVDISGIVADNVKVKRYELFYGIGENPASWHPALTGAGNAARPIAGSEPVNGRIGVWNMSNVNGSRFALKLKVIDEAGNVSCDIKTFSLDTAVAISALSADKVLFSNNSEVKATFQVSKNATVDVKVFKLHENAAFETIPVRTIISGQQQQAGLGNAAWNGRDDSVSAVLDGPYGIAVYATDSCGNTTMKWTSVEVDNTPPATVITNPTQTLPPTAGNIVEVAGIAVDIHFESYTLEAGEGDNPDSWRVISAKNTPVGNGILGSWNTFGLQGVWSLRLTASDSVGNKGIAKVVLNLDNRKTLIKTFETLPKAFSPNSDHKLDTSLLTYELSDPCDITIDITDAANAIVKTYTSSISASGIYNYIWDGTNNSNVTVSDGYYSVKITATLKSNASVTQTETMTVMVDTTLPAIDIKQPASNAFVSKTDMVINGEINDLSLISYSLSYTGSAGTTTLDSGNQNRVGYAFGTIRDLAEETYTITAVAKDLGENEQRVTKAFTVDRTPPKVTLDTPKAGGYFGAAKNSVDIAGSIVEKNLAHYSLRYGSGESPAQWNDVARGGTVPNASGLYSWNVGKDDGVADGVYTISLYAKDKAGMEGEVRTTIIVDNAPPIVSITSPKNGDYVKAAFDVRGSSSDLNLDKATLELAKGECSTAFKWVPIRTLTVSVADGVLESWNVLPADAEYCLKLSAEDKSGNKAETKVSFKLDAHPPAAPVLSGKIGNRIEAQLEWTQNSEQDIAGYNLYRDGQKQNSTLLASTIYSYRDLNLKEGVYAYTVKAVDLAGNESETSNTVQLRIDVTGPNVRIASPIDGAKVSNLVDIRGTAYSKDDFKQYRISIGEGATPEAWILIRTSPVPLSYGSLTPWDTLALSEGTYAVKLEGEDISGNITTHQVLVTIDNSPPKAPVIVSAVPSGSDVTLTWEPSDPDVAGYLIYRNDRLANASGIVIDNLKQYLVPGTAYVDRALSDGAYSYYVAALDQAGNPSNSATKNVVVETRAPHATIVEPAAGSKFETKILVRAETPDNDIQFVKFRYKRSQDTTWTDFGTATKAPYTAYLDLHGFPYDDYQIQAVATDTATPEKTDPAPSSLTVTYADLTAPDAPRNLRALTNEKEVTLSWLACMESDCAGYNIYRTVAEARGKINTAVVAKAGTPAYVDSNLDDGVYGYEITAVDTYGNESKHSNSALARVYAPLIVQPFTPTSQAVFKLEGSNTEANATVELFREATPGQFSSLGTAAADGQGRYSFDNVSLSLGENRIRAKATDGVGNISRTSDTIVAVYDEIPSAPVNLAASAQNYGVNLTWDPANTDPNISGYNVYRDGVKLNPPRAVTDGSATASSTYIEPTWPTPTEHSPSLALDQNEATQWRSDYLYNSDYWFQIDLPAPALISQLNIRWGTVNAAVYGGKDFEIQAWSGYAWIPLAKVTGNDKKENIFDFTQSYRTDKLRIHITAATDTRSYKEVRIAEIGILKDNLIPQTSYGDSNLKDHEYGYKVTAVDGYGFESAPSEAKVPVGDMIAPANPARLTATAVLSTITLEWSSNTEPDLAGYHVHRDSPNGWVKLTPTLLPGTASNYRDSNLPNGTYTYRLTAVDMVGNESGPDEAVAAVAVAPPPSPSALRVTPVPEGKALDLSWEFVGGAAVSLNLYRSTTTGGPYQKISQVPATTHTYRDTGLTNGTVYYYATAAADGLGNEGAYSAEVSGVPLDSVAPSKPLLSYPARAGVQAVLYSDRSNVAGMTEPGASVELFRGSDSLGRASALDADTIQATLSSYSGYQVALSPDGGYLAYSGYDGYLRLRNMSTGTAEKLVQNAQTPAWSPAGDKIALQYRDSAYNYRIGIYDLKARKIVPLTDDAYINEGAPSWSDDGEKILFYSNKSGYQNVWIKDIDSNSLTQVTTNAYATYPKVSPDGKIVAFFEGANLKIIDVATGRTTPIDSNANPNSHSWASDSSKLLFKAYRNSNYGIFILDMRTLGVVQVGDVSNYMTKPAWSPDNRSIVYGDRTNSVWIVDLQGEKRLLQQSLQSLPYLDWGKTGEIRYLDYTNAYIAKIQGYFVFKDVELDAGENIFYAIATDESGNASPSSEEITVVYDTSKLPDISIIPDDVSVYPSYPKPGEEVVIKAVVRNATRNPVDNAEVDLYLWDTAGNLELIKSTIVPHLDAEGTETVAARVNAGGLAGAQTIIAVVDSSDAIMELIESNNYATSEFYVTDKEETFVSTTLDADRYASNRSVAISVSLRNSGRERSGNMDILIEDAYGNKVASVDSVSVNLPYGGKESFSFAWNTASVFAGSYQVHTIVKGAEGAISESTVPFAILPDISIETSVVTDRLTYGPNENVAVTTSLKNKGTNYIVPGLKVRVRISNTQNMVQFADERVIQNLLPGMGSRLASNWNTGLVSPGDYSIVVEALLDGKMVSSTATRVAINPVSLVTGMVEVDTPTVLVGNTFRCAYTVSNYGNAETSGVLKVAIIDPATMVIAATDEKPATLAKDGTQTGEFILSSQGLELKHYRINLQYVSPDNQKTVASTSITLKDGTPPVVTVVSPMQNATYNSTIDLAALASDNASGVEMVAYQIDGGTWKLLQLADPTKGRYSAAWEPTIADNGPHTVGFRGTDRAGNTSTPVSVSFLIQMDNVPPVTILSIGAPKIEASSATFVTSASTFTLSATDNFSGVARTEYRIDDGAWALFAPFTIPGERAHVIEFRSQDNVGNLEAVKSQPIFVDNTPPASEVAIGSPHYSASGNIYVSGRTNLAIVATDGASGLKTSEYSIDKAAFVTYAEPFNLPALPEGLHSIAYRSTDNLRNQEQAKQLTAILDKTPPRTVITASDPLTEGVVNAVSPKTLFTLTATDSLAGVKGVWYRIDEGQWQLFSQGFTLETLPVGQHRISFASEDYVGNSEAEQAITVRVVSAELKKGISSEPFVLVSPWDDNDDDHRKNKKAEVDRLTPVLDAIGVTYHVASDEDDFEASIRSGKYNIYLLIDDKEERVNEELREGVYSGDGLIFLKTRPNANPDLDEIFGVKFTGKSTDSDPEVELEKGETCDEERFRSSGKPVQANIVTASARACGYVSDRHDRYPAVVYNEYGKGKVLLYTFNILSSLDTMKATELLKSAISRVKPEGRAVRALGSVPVRIEVVNSTEPLGLRVVEGFPPTSTVDTPKPEGTISGQQVTWERFLDGGAAALFTYFLNLPDAKGEYLLATEAKYGNYGEYRPLAGAELKLTVTGTSAELLQDAVTALTGLAAPTRQDRRLIAGTIAELQQVRGDASSQEDAEENIERITEAAEKVGRLSFDASEARLAIDRVMRVWQRKWYLLREVRRESPREDCPSGDDRRS
ncbi:MAG: fibronectin I domain-containing [Geobacteraceae bacterium]|nr:MAG: fibronectin I domain-containing [Geobacteraceae bacterium]